jgi:hypothetical protein
MLGKKFLKRKGNIKMKKMILLGVLSVGLLTGCSEAEIIYEGKLLPASTVEEIIADKLEVENPELDIEVDIYEETE